MAAIEPVDGGERCYRVGVNPWICTKQPQALAGTARDFSVLVPPKERVRREAERWGKWERRCSGCGVHQQAKGYSPPPDDAPCSICDRRTP
jgi:hypothetical protein